MAERPVRITHVNEETVLPGIVAALKVLVHEEGLAGAGRPQQEHIVILDEAGIHRFLLNVEALGNQPEPVTHLEHAVPDASIESVIDSQA